MLPTSIKSKELWDQVGTMCSFGITQSNKVTQAFKVSQEKCATCQFLLALIRGKKSHENTLDSATSSQPNKGGSAAGSTKHHPFVIFKTHRAADPRGGRPSIFGSWSNEETAFCLLAASTVKVYFSRRSRWKFKTQKMPKIWDWVESLQSEVF